METNILTTTNLSVFSNESYPSVTSTLTTSTVQVQAHCYLFRLHIFVFCPTTFEPKTGSILVHHTTRVDVSRNIVTWKTTCERHTTTPPSPMPTGGRLICFRLTPMASLPRSCFGTMPHCVIDPSQLDRDPNTPCCEVVFCSGSRCSRCTTRTQQRRRQQQ